MSSYERFPQRDKSYSAWHREASISRFVEPQVARSLTMIDLDCVLYIEYSNRGYQPIALIETARDSGKDYKNATVTTNLAKMARLPAFVLLYSHSPTPNPFADCKDISCFRVRRAWPNPTGWHGLLPGDWAHCLKLIHDGMALNVDAFLAEADERYTEHWQQACYPR